MHALILLDTHALLWWNTNSDRLGRAARSVLGSAETSQDQAVSAITFMEFGTLWRKGRMRFASDLVTWRQELLDGGLRELPVDGAVAIRANQLDGFHADPADRIIVATAQLHGAMLVTADERILAWPGEVLRLDARR